MAIPLKALGVVAHAVEGHRLADAAKPDHHHAAGRSSAADPFDGDTYGFAQLVTAREFRRRDSDTGSERVGDDVHAGDVGKLGSLSKSHKFPNFPIIPSFNLLNLDNPG
jgi:hypothetical protein